MTRKTIQCEFEEYQSLDELDRIDKLLLKNAIEISANAYAPYSSFCVGAAVLLENDEIVTGSNQENIAYPSGLCAERVALFAAHSKFPSIRVKAIAIYAQSADFKVEEIVSPCGACRQVMAEYEGLGGKPIEIIMGSQEMIIKTVGISQLLPLMFSSKGLKSEG